jgi:hypothetical protein
MKIKVNHWFPIISIVILSVSVWVFAVKKNEMQQVQEITNRADQYSMILLKNSGYGGLIHHFKNYLLRREESDYKKARINAYELQKLNVILEGVKSPTILQHHSELMAMFQHYIDGLEVIKKYSWDEIDNIDERVRYDDAYAISIIEDIRLARVSLSEQLKLLQRETLYIMYGLIVFSLMTLLISLYFNYIDGLKKLHLKRERASYTTTKKSLEEMRGAVLELTQRLIPERFKRSTVGMIRVAYVGNDDDIELAKIATYLLIEDRTRYVIKTDALYLEEKHVKHVTAYLLKWFKKIKLPVALNVNASDDEFSEQDKYLELS